MAERQKNIAVTLIAVAILNSVAFFSNAQNPQASFITNQTTGCTPLTIQFTNTSQNSISYYWDLGNGNISFLKNPSNVYLNSGTYSVKLIVISQNGQKDSIIKTNLITVVPNPVSDFLANNTTFWTGADPVSFANSSINSTSCLWDFGDGNTSTQQNVTHSYTSQGNYTIKLISYNSNGCVDIKTKTNYIHIIPKVEPTFTVNAVSACQVNQVFNFVSTTSAANSWLWNFGDGKTSTLQNPQHIYNSQGVYSVSLITNIGSKAVDSVVKINYISVFSEQTPTFTINSDSGCSLLPLTFTNTSPNTKSWLWDFGDNVKSTLENPDHTYKINGNYSVSLTVTTNDGCSYTTIKNNFINILENATSKFSLDNGTGCAPLNVNFKNSSQNDTGSVWEFGDGSTSTLKNPSHIYTTEGKYTVTLHSSSASGCNSTYTIQNAVTIAPPIAEFTASMIKTCSSLKATFNNTSLNATKWLWKFGDGETSTLKNPVHIYNFNGDYDVSLIASDGQGCNDTLTFYSYVEVNNSMDEYTPPETTIGCAPLNAAFEKTTIGAVSWLWNFGDGDVSNVRKPTHTFEKAGSYTVSLTMKLTNGCTQSIQNFQTFEVQGGAAKFEFNQSKCAPNIVDFTDTTYSNAISWFWDFGDGETSTLQNPKHTYLGSEFYTVIHEVETAIGCESKIIESNLIHFKPCSDTSESKDTAIESFPINVNGAIGLIKEKVKTTKTPNQLGGCIPVLVQFHNINSEATSWYWNFGDGSTSTLENPIHSYTKNGTFDVTMIGSNSGKTDTLIYPKYIKTSGIETNFSFIQKSDCVNSTLFFADSTKDAISWQWNFGDGVKDTLQNPNHPYFGTKKNYVIELKTTNADGCSSKMTSNFINSIENPILKSDKYLVCGNQPVGFTCSSLNSNTYLWDFGDGKTSILKNVTHSYLNDSSYSVKLTLSNSNGCTRVLSLSKPITVQYPKADFLFALENGCNSTSVNFSNKSKATSLPLSAHSKWDFGDGSSTQWIDNSIHSFPGPGTYNVKLFVNTEKKCFNTITKKVNIYPTVVADFKSVQNKTCLPIVVTYNDLSTKAVSWRWDFGDGTISDVQNPIHTFTTIPTSGVTLTITDTNGCQANITKPNITILKPEFTVSNNTGCAPLNVAFSDLSTNSNSWLWDFGDGAYSTLQSPKHVFLKNGGYTVKLISKTEAGCVDTIVNSVNIVKPKADFISHNPTKCSPALVTFIDQSIDATEWLWNFGDGSTSFNQNPGHIYNVPGLYSIKLMVKNSQGCTDTLIRTNYIKVPGTIAKFNISKKLFCEKAVVQFVDSSIQASSWNWNFGDGNTSTLQHPTNIYEHSGPYTVSLIVHDSMGCTSNFTLANPIKVNSVPISNFTVSDTTFCSPFSVSFNNLSQNAVTYEWHFGDNDTSSLKNPIHSYLTPGSYTVSLIAKNGAGCTDTSSHNNLKGNPLPKVNFTSNKTAGCSNLIVSFSDSSSSITDERYFWDFGNGIGSREQNPTATFTNPGKYPVSLTITNNIGCTKKIVKPSFIEIYSLDPPEKSSIICATVIADNSTYLIWEPCTANDFDHYEVYRKDNLTDNYVSVGIINKISEVSFTDDKLNTLVNSYCYKVRTFDQCGYALPLDSLNEHCTINVTAKGHRDHIQVDWTPYIGADVDTYSIYRMETGSPATTLVATVPSKTITIIDTNMYCPEEYSYRIKANKLNGNAISSSSDTSIAKPSLNILSQQKVDIVRSTVIDNSAVLTEWKAPDIAPKAVTGYNIYKSTDNINFSLITNVSSVIHQYIDTNVDVNAQKCYYKIEVKNSCNSTTMISNQSSSILLKAELTNGSIMLNWTKYDGWDMGVDYYIIEKLNEDGSWEIIKKVDGNQLNFQVD